MSDSMTSSPISTPNGSPVKHSREGIAIRSPSRSSPNSENILLYLIGYRVLNALLVETFFQPDEYFQSLEPAWRLAFGAGSSAWITWEWKSHLRSAIHPAIFAGAYQLAHAVCAILSLSSPLRANLLIATPKLVQAVIAAIGDYYTWKLARYIYEARSNTAWAALALSIVSPWQWFCSTRTFSNCFETSLTIIALYNWPWHWFGPRNDAANGSINCQGLRVRNVTVTSRKAVDEVTRLRRSLLCAALATILRPTNILIWILLVFSAILRGNKSYWSSKKPDTTKPVINSRIVLPAKSEIFVFLRETLLCGSSILLLSAFVDRAFYQTWTFPPYNFLRVNVLQGISVFYGNNNWHYYLSQGYPLLLTTALPFTAVGLYNSIRNPARLPNVSTTSRNILYELAIVSVFVPAVLSVISHKEVRFIYPLLPLLHIITAPSLITFFAPAFQNLATVSKFRRRSRRFAAFVFVSINAAIALYTTRFHNSGLISVTHYLRHEFELRALEASSQSSEHPVQKAANMTVGFLMPCHSTPWRSHLQYPPAETQTGIDAWALTCEPPLGLSPSEKATYLDEADQFYADPSTWLKRHMSRHFPSAMLAQQHKMQPIGIHDNAGVRDRRKFNVESDFEETQWRERNTRRPWPEYLIFFEQLESVTTSTLRGSGYVQCTRIFNSHFHDDWRRTGDIVVWCLHPERADTNPSKTKTPASLWDGIKSFLPGNFNPTMEEIEDSLHNPPHKPTNGHKHSTLLGGRQQQQQQRNGNGLPKLSVEKPFWKQRPKEEQKVEVTVASKIEDWVERIKRAVGYEDMTSKDKKKTAKKKTKKGSLWS